MNRYHLPGVLVRQAQELLSRIHGNAPNPDYCFACYCSIADRPGWLAVLRLAHKERRAILCTLFRWQLAVNNHDAGIRDDPETP
jgi:hypothetical protein